jgi:heme ABC exporter ATP-binding subunit CcmA
MTASTVLRCDNIAKRFGRTTALRSVTFSVDEGEFVVVFGHNGAGKSTLLNIVATLIRSYQGKVSLFGRDLAEADEGTRRSIGFMSHDSFLYADLTAFENLFFYARLYGLRDPSGAASEMLAGIKLSHKSHSVTRELSRGMKQRLSLGRAFLHSPKLLLLDEPYTGLDETACANLNEMLSGFTAGGGTVLMTTHDIDRGFRVADRALVLDRGSIVVETETADIGLEEFRHRYSEILAK